MVDGWAGILYLGHIFGAEILKIPELVLSRPEAEQVSVASINILRHYAPLGAITEKMQDLSAFVLVCGAVYVPRLQQRAIRLHNAKVAARAAPPPPGMNSAGGYEQPKAQTEDEILSADLAEASQ